jgi:hypothetical protein
MADLPSDRNGALVRNEVQTAAGGLVVQVGTINGDAYFNGPPGPDKHDELTLISDEFAAGVRKRWLEEERRRKVRDPASLPVRWVAADDALMDHWANICLTRVGEEAEPLDLAGQLDEIADIYGRIPSGRLVLLGRDGSGKTVLGLRLVLDLLESRRSGEPVPEMFSIGSWEPTVEPLTKWLSDQLCRDQPGLATVGADGETLAAALLGRGLILPVLDGFDEIAAGLRRDALRELSATTGPLVLTSRPAEYTAAGAGTRCLSHAAAIELADLTLADLKDYLLRSSPKNITPDWLQVLAELHRDPHAEGNANLAAALTTPLMVSLAGTVYGESRDDQHDAIADRPTALLDTSRFSTSRSIEEHLLSTFLPTVYRLRPGDARTAPRHKWDPERAQRWLGNLAVHLDRLGTRNLAWWEFGHSVRASTRLLVISFLSGLSFAMVTGIGNIPIDLFGTSHGLGFAVRRGIVVGLLHGSVAALAFGFLFRLAEGSETLKPSPVRIRLFHRRTGRRSRPGSPLEPWSGSSWHSRWCSSTGFSYRCSAWMTGSAADCCPRSRSPSRSGSRQDSPSGS